MDLFFKTFFTGELLKLTFGSTFIIVLVNFVSSITVLFEILLHELIIKNIQNKILILLWLVLTVTIKLS